MCVCVCVCVCVPWEKSGPRPMQVAMQVYESLENFMERVGKGQQAGGSHQRSPACLDLRVVLRDGFGLR